MTEERKVELIVEWLNKNPKNVVICREKETPANKELSLRFTRAMGTRHDPTAVVVVVDYDNIPF